MLPSLIASFCNSARTDLVMKIGTLSVQEMQASITGLIDLSVLHHQPKLYFLNLSIYLFTNFFFFFVDKEDKK